MPSSGQNIFCKLDSFTVRPSTSNSNWLTSCGIDSVADLTPRPRVGLRVEPAIGLNRVNAIKHTVSQRPGRTTPVLCYPTSRIPGERSANWLRGYVRASPSGVAQTFQSAVSPTFQSANPSEFSNARVLSPLQVGKPAIRQTGKSALRFPCLSQQREEWGLHFAGRLIVVLAG